MRDFRPNLDSVATMAEGMIRSLGWHELAYPPFNSSSTVECINCKLNLDWLYNDNIRLPLRLLAIRPMPSRHENCQRNTQSTGKPSPLRYLFERCYRQHNPQQDANTNPECNFNSAKDKCK